MTRSLQPDDLGRILNDLRSQLHQLQTSPRLTRASIKDGALRILDEDDEERAKFGRLDADLDGDGDPDWGLAIFDDAGDWALLGTKAGVFVRGSITGGTIDIGGDDASSFHVDAAGNLWVGAALFADAPFRVAASGDVAVEGGTIVGSNVETAASPAPRVKVTDDAPAPYEAAIQFFTGTEPADAQGFIGEYVDPFTSRAIVGLGPSGLAGAGYANRALMFLVSKRADGTGDREILLYAGEKLYVDAAEAQFTGDAHVFGGFKVAGRDTDGQARGGFFSGTADGAGDLVFPHDMGAAPLGVSVTMAIGSAFGAALMNPVVVAIDATNVQVRFYNSSTGAALNGAHVEGYFTATR
jgi:hypothetical protein